MLMGSPLQQAPGCQRLCGHYADIVLTSHHPCLLNGSIHSLCAFWLPPAIHADGKIAAFLEERLNVGVNFVLSAEGAPRNSELARALARRAAAGRHIFFTGHYQRV